MNKKRVWKIRITVLLAELVLLIGVAYATIATIKITCEPCEPNIVSLKWYQESEDNKTLVDADNSGWLDGHWPPPVIETWDWAIEGASTGGTLSETGSPDSGSNSERDVRFTNAGIYDIIAEGTDEDGAWGEDTCNDFIVFDTQLGVDGVSGERKEDALEVYIALNDDDDNKNGKWDWYGDEGSILEDDMIEIDLINCLPDGVGGTDELTVGCIELRTCSGLRVWSSQAKASPVLNWDYYKRWQVDSPPTTPLWLEGCWAGAHTLELWYTPDDMGTDQGDSEYPSGTYNADVVKVTVVQVDLDMDGVDDQKEESDGGYILLGSLKRIELQDVLPAISSVPIDSSHLVKIGVTGAASKVKIWDNDQKAGSEESLPIEFDARYSVPQEFWVEGCETSSAVKDITLVAEYSIGGVTIQDEIKLTVVEVDIDIYNGQEGVLAPEDDPDGDGIEDEEAIGAFTVANLNDTNGNNIVDSEETDPVVANGTLGRPERDLMKLVLQQPKPAGLTGEVVVTIVSGDVKIWNDSIKTTEVTDLEIPISAIPADGWWVEARSPTALQDIKLEYRCKPTGASEWIGPDTVTATGIWAYQSKVIYQNLTASQVNADLLAGDPQYDDYQGTTGPESQGGWNVMDFVNKYDGTGVKLGWRYRNVIVYEFQVSPSNIYSGVPDEYGNGTWARPRFDVTRQVESGTFLWPSGATRPIQESPPPHRKNPHFPEEVGQDNEKGSDDPARYLVADENDEPTDAGHLWDIDGPYAKNDADRALRAGFRVFVRMSTTEDPSDCSYGVSGSRCSDKYEWHSETTTGFNGDPLLLLNMISTGPITFEPEALDTRVDTITLAAYGQAVMRGLSIAGTAGSATETMDLYLKEHDDPPFYQTLAQYGDWSTAAGPDIHDPTITSSEPQVVGKYDEASDTEVTLIGDQTAYTGVTLLGTGLDAKVHGYHGPCYEGQSGDYAEVYHEIVDPISNPKSHWFDTLGEEFSLLAPLCPNPLLLGANNVTATGLYTTASDHGAGTEMVTIDLWEFDADMSDKLVTENAAATRPDNTIKNTAVPISGTTTFVVTNTAGTLSGNEANENPVQLFYGYDPGTSTIIFSPLTTANVEQP